MGRDEGASASCTGVEGWWWWRGGGVMQDTEKQRTQCIFIRIWQVTTRWQQSCHAGRGGIRRR